MNIFEQRVEIVEDYCPGCGYLRCECEPLQRALSMEARRQNTEGWKLLTRAHFHVWRDTTLDWRVRFDVSSLLWNKAMSLFTENIVGRAA